MPTSDELKQEAGDALCEVCEDLCPIMVTEYALVRVRSAIDCIIEAAVMEAVEKMKGHSHDHSHFSPSDTLFR